MTDAGDALRRAHEFRAYAKCIEAASRSVQSTWGDETYVTCPILAARYQKRVNELGFTIEPHYRKSYRPGTWYTTGGFFQEEQKDMIRLSWAEKKVTADVRKQG